MEGCIESRKRLRDDSSNEDSSFFSSKIVRNDSDFISPVNSRSIEPEQIFATTIQEDLLKILDETDATTDRESAILGLDSVIRSFEEEINVPNTTSIEVVSESGVSGQPDLGYLLEASDDELGLPPTDGGGEKEKMEMDEFVGNCNGMKGLLGFEEEVEVSSYCWFDSLSSECGNLNNGLNESEEEEEEIITLGGLFDCTDVTLGVEFRSDTMFCL